MTLRLVCFCVAVFVLVAPSNAGAILSPVAMLANSAGEAAPGDAAHVFDQSGLSSTFTSGVTDFATYMAGSPSHTFLYSGFEWFSSLGVHSGFFIFDLGAAYNLLHVADWNDEFSGLTSLTVSTCATAACAAPVAIGGGTPTNWPDTVTSYTADVFALSGASSRYLRIDMTGPQALADYDGLSMGEIAFDVTPAAAPEPSSLFLIASGALVFGIRRLRVAAKVRPNGPAAAQ